MSSGLVFAASRKEPPPHDTVSNIQYLLTDGNHICSSNCEPRNNSLMLHALERPPTYTKEPMQVEDISLSLLVCIYLMIPYNEAFIKKIPSNLE